MSCITRRSSAVPVAPATRIVALYGAMNEILAGMGLTDRLVARTEAGHVAMVPPTRTLVDELHRLGSIDAALAVAGASGPIEPVRDNVSGPRPRRAP